MLNIAVRAIRQGASVLSRAYMPNGQAEVVQQAGFFVAKSELDSEKAIIASIHKSYPDHSIVARHAGNIQPGHEYVWIIEPLSGAMNFIKGIPHFAVAVTLQIKGRSEVAAIYSPMTDELYTAVRGSGAQLNGYRIRVSPETDLQKSIIGTGFPNKARQHSEAYFAMQKEIFLNVEDIRRDGSTALDLAYVAAGRFEGFFELNASIWSLIPGALIATEAGAVITDVSGGYDFKSKGHVVLGSPKVTQSLLKVIRTSLSDALKKAS